MIAERKRVFDTIQLWSGNGHEQKPGAALPIQGVYRTVRALRIRAQVCNTPIWTATQPLAQHWHEQGQDVKLSSEIRTGDAGGG